METIIQFIQFIIVIILMLFGGGDDTPTTVTPLPLSEGSYIQVHYIDVGQADAALVICDDETMLIDGGNVADSDLIYTYLKDRKIKHLDYIVSTHPHEDHVGGLSGALQYATVGKAYSPVTVYDSKAFQNFKSALSRQNVSLTVPDPGDDFILGSALVTILACDGTASDTNNTSIVLRIDHGETSFLFTGDAEREVEQHLLDTNEPLGATVLKLGHHGSNSSTGYQFLYEVAPKYAVISVGAKNQYGHPDEETLSRLKDADVTVFRTDKQGDIVCTGDGEALTFRTIRR